MFKRVIKGKSPRNLLFVFEILALLLLLIYQGEKIDKLTLGTGLGLVLVIYLSNYLLTKVSTGDNYIFLIVTMLISIGIIMIYRIDEGLGIKQLIWLSAGIFIFFITYFILKYIRGWGNWIYLYIAGAYILFFITFIFGSRKKGAINWVSLGKIAFQPAEITKLLLIFILAAYYSNISKWKERKYSSYYLMGIVYSFITLLFLQRDLGTSLVFYAIFIAIQFIYEEDRKLVLYNIGFYLTMLKLGFKPG